MSTTAAKPERTPHAPYAEPDEFIDYQLRKTQAGIKHTDMSTAAVVSAAILIGYLLLFVICDHWLFDGGITGPLRWLLWLPVVGAVGWLIATKLILPALRSVNGLFAAKTLESSAPEFGNSLLSLIDLKRANRPVAAPILATMEKRAAVALTKFNVDDAIDKRFLLRTLCILLGLVVTFCLYSILSPKKLGPSVLRAVLPFSNIRPATQTEIVEVTPGNVKLRAGGSQSIEVRLRGDNLPSEARLFYTTVDRRFVNEPQELSPTTEPQRFTGILGNDEQGLLQSLTYYIVAGDARSAEYRIDIVTPPSATVTDVRFEYPQYTELDSTTQPGGAIDVWERTGVTINAKANMPIKLAEFELSDTEDFAPGVTHPGPAVKFDDSRTQLTIAWRADPRQSDAKFPKFYRLKVWDDEKNPDPKPAVYPINVRVDQPPQVVLLDPTANLEVPANATIPLAVAARDPDFKLRTVSLKIARDANDVTDETLFDGARQEVFVRHDFALEPLRLNPGDKFRIWIEAQDNRLPTHNLSKTAPLEITIKNRVSKDEARQQLAQQKQEQQQRIEEQLKNNDTGTERAEQQPSDLQPNRDSNPRNPDTAKPDQPQADQSKADDASERQQADRNESKQDDKQVGKNGGSKNSQQGNSGTSKASETGGTSERSQKNDSGQGTGSDQQSLRNDGTDDDRALQRIANHEKRQGRWPKNKSGSSPAEKSNQPETPENSPNSDSENPKTDRSDNDPIPEPAPKGASDNKRNVPTNQQPGQPKSNPNSSRSDSDQSDEPTGREGSERNPKGKPDKTSDAKSNDNDDPKPSNDPNSSQGRTPRNDPAGKASPNKDAASKDADSNDPDKSQNADQGDMTDNKSPGRKGSNEANPPEKTQDRGQSPMPKSGNSDPDSTGKKDPNQPGNPPPSDAKPDQSPSGAAKKDRDPNKQGQPGEVNSEDKSDRPDGAPKSSPAEKKDDRDQTGSKNQSNPDQKPQRGQSGKKPDGMGKKSEQDVPDQKPESDDKQDSPAGKEPAKDSNSPTQDSKPSSDGKEGDSAAGQQNQSGKSNDSKQSGKASDKSKGASGQQQPPRGKSDSSSDDTQSSSESSEGSGKSKKGKAGNNKSQGQSTKSSKSGESGQSGADAQSSSAGEPNDLEASPVRDQSGQAGSSDAEPVNEEFTKEAANLVLKRLQKQLERGEVDQDLLDELGWTPEAMQKYLDRMQKNFDVSPEDDSPSAKARRRQFEEMLRNLDLTSKAQRREDSTKDKQSGDGVGSVRRPPPPHLRDWWESYTKGMSKKKSVDPAPTKPTR